MKIGTDRKIITADCTLLCLLTLVIGIFAYHPYYFGDELLPFFFAQQHGASIWSIFDGLNKYKPRLIFNGIWAVGAYYGAPRYVFMLFTVGATGFLASLIYYIARIRFGESRLISLLAGVIIPSSRFIMLSYYDYLAGLIETLSALFYLIAVILILLPQIFVGVAQKYRYIVGIIACVMAVFVHERYMAGAAALGAVVIVKSFDFRRRVLDFVGFAAGIAMAGLPVLLFIVATRAFGSLPIATGTAGMQVSISLGILERMLTYCGNVLFGLNAGHQWLVGGLQYVGTLNVAILTGLAFLFGLAYICIFTLWRKQIEWRKVIEIVFLAGALICIASLPDASRQEGRWMTPVLALMTLMALHFGRARLAYLTVLIVMNLTYIVTGSHLKVFNVVASRSADAIAAPLNRIRPEGVKGIVLNAPDNGESWVLGGDNAFGNDITSGKIFSRLNLSSQTVVDPGISTRRDYDFGIYYTGMDSSLKPLFSYVGHRRLSLLLNPDEIGTDLGRVIGGQDAWRAWHWSGGVVESGGSVELRPGVVGIWTAPTADLEHMLIVYRARALTDDVVPMRIQVNWADKKGRFLGAFIKVVSVGKATENYATVIAAPTGACEGTVYANLHDGATGSVELSSIRLIGD
ncbi:MULTISPECIES: hypothetical protein [Rhodanobacter]|uniref:hypothetical protein n=1 Tax=Rhodanobacter TaxID=75309 RepID=UPI0003F74478|nr:MULTISPECIES: hypothetical protein [Rhodanobacter]UJJ51651.1 hypothetical protein LRK52_02880 [Rhodanobacter denitrificans]UJM94395.1 hypothetical protein LRK32_02875 [Rhodanobacter denitrificans]UJM97925.1 hypothetical protein LRK44_02880 [Rhodanobacter denitrificans]UJN22661.1 hypothetical protein LRK54_05615 [Rhodanobacter denitrificans]